MASALSVDLSEHIEASIEAGASRRDAARRFEVSQRRALARDVCAGGRLHTKPMGGDQRSHTTKVQAGLIRQTDEELSVGVEYSLIVGIENSLVGALA